MSSENYTQCTRSAFGDILHWPNQWIAPPRLRAIAKRRSGHLGLSSLDIDVAQDAKSDNARMTAQIPKTLLKKPRDTVSGILGKSTHRSQFRLDAVTSEFLEPLSELLADKDWLLAETCSSLDCLAVGYLALMQSPEVPHNWLKRSLRDRFSNLAKWTDTFLRECYGGPMAPANAFLNQTFGDAEKRSSTLPWQVPMQPTFAAMGGTVVQGVLDSIPVVGQFRTNKQLKQAAQNPELDDLESKQLARIARNRNRELYSQIMGVGAGIGAFIGYLFWVGLLKLPDRSKRKENGRRDFGEAGTLLGL